MGRLEPPGRGQGRIEHAHPEYDYNGLNWRITKRADASEPPDGTLNQERRMYYNANWQLLEEHIDDAVGGSFSIDRRMQYFWGQRYIDDIVMRRQDVGNDGIWNDTWYHITDTLFSTVAIIDQNANLIERVSYDAYGNARHHRMGDLIGDGATTTDDRNLLRGNTGNYGVGDLNRDGIVDSADLVLLDNDTGGALPAGQLSAGASGTDNIIGYAGYIFNAEIPGAGLYTVRHRHYAPDLGRWLSRDPLGYVDGMSLYEYVRGQPITSIDFSGLLADDPGLDPGYKPPHRPIRFDPENESWPNPALCGDNTLTPQECFECCRSQWEGAFPIRWYQECTSICRNRTRRFRGPCVNPRDWGPNDNCLTFGTCTPEGWGIPRRGWTRDGNANCEVIRQGLKDAGAEEPDCGDCPEGTYIVVPYRGRPTQQPGPTDFHLIRPDCEGNWWHIPGFGAPPTDRDYDGKSPLVPSKRLHPPDIPIVYERCQPLCWPTGLPHTEQ